MKLIDNDEREIIVHFSYSRYGGKRITICHIHTAPCEKENNDGPCTKVYVAGVASCSRKDEFTKTTGRKIAMARAMERFQFTRENRKALWHSYLSQTRPFTFRV